MPRTVPRFLYHRRKLDDDFLMGVEIAYKETQNGKPKLFKTHGGPEIALLWGKQNAAGEFEIGVRGRFWVLALLLAQHSEANKLPAELARQIVSSTTTIPQEERSDTATALKNFISQTFTGTQIKDPAQFRRLFQYLVRKTAGSFGSAANIPDVSNRLMDEKFTSFKALFYRACVLLKIDPQQPSKLEGGRLSLEALSLCSDVESLFTSAMHGRLSERYSKLDEDKVAEVIDALNNTEGSCLIAIEGDESSGKKGIVRGFLQQVLDDAGFVVFRPWTPDAIAMPIFAVSARDMSYPELVRKVCRFLKAYAAARGKETQNYADNMEIAEGLQAVIDLHDAPALFIFTDLELAAADRPRHVIRDYGYRRLLAAIFEGDSNSKVIITTSSRTEKLEKADAASLPEPDRIEVAPPSLKDLQFFVRDELPSSLNEPTWKSDLRGHVMIALGALINLSNGITAPIKEVVDPFATKTLVAESQRRIIRVRLFEMLVEQIAVRGMLEAVTLIALSSDGIRNDTLLRALADWQAATGTPCGFKTTKELQTSLESFAEAIGARFLRNVPAVSFDPEEYGFEEKAKSGDMVWDIQHTVSARLLFAVQNLRPDVSRIANRLMAMAARRRSLSKRLRMQRAGYRPAIEARRDIQAYVSLLASIPPDELVASDSVSTDFMLDRVFTLHPDEFNAPSAFRFAYQSLLRDGIDRDFRLTIADDEDDLRLHLYLLLLQEPGRRHTLEDKELEIPTDLPGFISEMIDDPCEVIELLTSIALSAYHAQRPDLLLNVVKLAEDFVNTRPEAKQRALYHRMARMWCAKFDLFIFRGAPVGGGTHADSLSLLNDLLSKHFRDAEAFFINPSALTATAVNDNALAIEGRLRLLARKAEFIALTEPRSAGEIAYWELMQFDNAFSSLAVSRRRSTLGGRTARRYLRFLFRDPVFQQNDGDAVRRREIFEIVGRLMDLNTDRLGRFSGAERVGCMLDAARFHYFSGDIDAARSYATVANELSYMANVSHNGKLDVLLVNADLACIKAQQLIDSVPRDEAEIKDELRNAEAFTEALYEIAEDLGYSPNVGLAKYMKLKIAHVRNQLEGDDDLRRDAMKQAGDEASLIAEVQDISMAPRIGALLDALNSDDQSARFP